MQTGDVLTNAEIAQINCQMLLRFKELIQDNAFKAGHEYEIVSLGLSDGVLVAGDAAAIAAGTSVMVIPWLLVQNLQLMQCVLLFKCLN